MHITNKTTDDYVILSISGNLSVENQENFENILSDFFKEKKHIIIDLENVSFIDSSTLGIIVLYFTNKSIF